MLVIISAGIHSSSGILFRIYVWELGLIHKMGRLLSFPHWIIFGLLKSFKDFPDLDYEVIIPKYMRNSLM